MRRVARSIAVGASSFCLVIGLVVTPGTAVAAPPVSDKDKPWTARISGIDAQFRVVGLIVNSKTGGRPVVDWGDGTVERIQKCVGLKSDPVCSVGVMHQYKTGGTWPISVQWKDKKVTLEAKVPAKKA